MVFKIASDYTLHFPQLPEKIKFFFILLSMIKIYMYCRNCSKEIENNSSFCIHCGEKLGQPEIKGINTPIGNNLDDLE